MKGKREADNNFNFKSEKLDELRSRVDAAFDEHGDEAWEQIKGIFAHPKRLILTRAGGGAAHRCDRRRQLPFEDPCAGATEPGRRHAGPRSDRRRSGLRRRCASARERRAEKQGLLHGPCARPRHGRRRQHRHDAARELRRDEPEGDGHVHPARHDGERPMGCEEDQLRLQLLRRGREGHQGAL